MEFKITVLGSGTSTGVPMVGCACAVCTSPDPKDQRLRSSILITTRAGKKILVDTGPDLRTQLLRAKVTHLDAVVITHEHADHLHGVDDLRPLTFGPPRRAIDVHVFGELEAVLKGRFPYIFNTGEVFKSKKILGGGIPLLSTHAVPDGGGLFSLAGETAVAYHLPHGHTITMGLRIGRFAYLIDCHDIPAPALEDLRRAQLDLLIIDCLQLLPHDTHLSMERAFGFIRQISPKRAGLIHMNHALSHRQLTTEALAAFDFPVFPVYDQQEFTLHDGEKF